jgi:hypothetical protein
MASAAGNRQRTTMLGVVALLASALTIVAYRTITSARELEARPLPNADLQSLAPYLQPLSDTSILAQGAANTMVVPRDPFVASGVARAGLPIRMTLDSNRSTSAGEQHWVVSSILVEGSKKSAIVNDAWVTIGDTLGGGSRLTAVERDHIVVTDAKGVRHKVPIQGGES